MTGAVFLQVVLRFLGPAGIDGLEEVPRYPVRLAGDDRRRRGHAPRRAHGARLFRQSARPARPRAGASSSPTPSASLLFLYLIKLSFVLVPNAQLQTSAGPGAAARLRLRRDPGRLRSHHPADGAQSSYRALRSAMAETLLIVFIVFILLGMPISIALGVGALGAAMFYPGAQPDHHPDPLRRPALGFLPAAVGAAVHPGRQHRGARRRGARASSTSPPRWSAASAAGSPTSTSSTACSSAASRARRWPTSRRSARS